MGAPTMMTTNQSRALFLLASSILFSCALAHWGSGARDVDPMEDQLTVIGDGKPYQFSTKGLSREEALFFGYDLPPQMLRMNSRGRIRYVRGAPGEALNKKFPLALAVHAQKKRED